VQSNCTNTNIPHLEKKIKTSKTSEKHKTSRTSMSTDTVNIVNNNTVFKFNAVTSISNT